MSSPMTNDTEIAEQPMHPVNIMCDIVEQHTMWLLNMCIGTTWGRVRRMEFGGKDTTATDICPHF